MNDSAQNEFERGSYGGRTRQSSAAASRTSATRSMAIATQRRLAAMKMQQRRAAAGSPLAYRQTYSANYAKPGQTGSAAAVPAYTGQRTLQAPVLRQGTNPAWGAGYAAPRPNILASQASSGYGQQYGGYPGYGSGASPQGTQPYGKRWPYRGRYGYGTGVDSGTYDTGTAGASQFVLSLQNDLSDVLGISLPRNGMWSAATRRAFQKFQRSIGLPVTGRPTRSNLRVLRAMAAQARNGNAGFDDSAAPAGNAWAPPPDPAAAPPPEPPPPPDAGPDDAPADTAAGGDEPPQEEFHLANSGAVTLLRRPTLPLDDPNIDQRLPDRPGLYVISVGPSNLPWYVGITERSVQGRFRPRWKILRDFNLGPGDLKGKSITCYTLPSVPAIQVLFRQGRSGPLHPRKGVKGILLALEEHFIRSLGTAGKGNEQRSNITFGQNVSVDLQFVPALPKHPVDSKIPLTMMAPAEPQVR